MIHKHFKSVMHFSFLSLLLVFAVSFAAASASNPLESNTAYSEAPGCSYIIYLTMEPDCDVIWCSDNGSNGSFHTDRDGHYQLNDVCLGTYYFCPQCPGSGGAHVVNVDGTAIVYYNYLQQALCPCN